MSSKIALHNNTLEQVSESNKFVSKIRFGKENEIKDKINKSKNIWRKLGIKTRRRHVVFFKTVAIPVLECMPAKRE